MENPDQLHHLESPSVYGEQIQQISDQMRDMNIRAQRPIPSIPEEGIPTPRYHTPNEDRRYNPIMFNQIKPEPYDGKTDPRKWLTYYNDIADANMWDTDYKFRQLINALKDAPLQWFQNAKARDPSFNWTKFSQGLVEKYTNECDYFMAQINIMKRVQ